MFLLNPDLVEREDQRRLAYLPDRRFFQVRVMHEVLWRGVKLPHSAEVRRTQVMWLDIRDDDFYVGV